MAQEYNAANFTDALTRLPEYGGYEALSGALGEAYPDATFSPYSDNSYDKGFQYASLPTGAGNAGGPFTTFNPTAMQRIVGSGNIYDSIYKAVWPTLTGLVGSPPLAAPTLASSPLSSYPVMDKARFTGEWEQLPEAPAYESFNYLPGYTLAPKKDIPALSHISPAEQERILWLNTASGASSGAYAAGAAIPYALNPQGVPYGQQGDFNPDKMEGNLPIPEYGRITPEWLDSITKADKYTKYGVTPYTDVEQPQIADLDVGSYEDAFRDIKLKYGEEGLKKLAENLNTAFPEGDYKLKTEMIKDSSRGGAAQPHSSYISYTDPKTGVGKLGGSIIPHIYERMFEGGFMTPEAYAEKLRPDLAGAKNLSGIPAATYNPEDPYGNVFFEKYVPEYNPYRTRINELAPILQQTLTQLNTAPEIEQQNAAILASQPSQPSGAITTTSGGILGGTSPLTSPTSTSLTDSMPSQEDVNNTAYKDFVNKTVGKDIFDLEDDSVKVDSSQVDVVDRTPSFENSSVDELIATATSERTPYTSQVPSSADKYLQGGTNAFAYSGEGGYAAERQRMLGRAPDIYQGPEVPWQRLGKDAPSDVYYGNQRVNAPTGEVADGGGVEEFDWNEWRKNRIIADIPEGAFHPGNDNWGVNVNKHYGDLETVQKEKLMEGAEKYWGDSWIGTGLYEEFPTDDTEDFRFFNHDGVNKNVTDGLSKIKDIFTKTGEGIKKGAGILKGVVDELTRITERKGGRGSTTEGDPFGVSTTGMVEGLLKILTLDFDGKKLDKQEYGNIQPAALIAAGLVPGLLPIQLANEVKDFVKDSFNISGFADPEYKAGGSFADAKNNATEFTASLVRPLVHTIAKIFTDKPIDDSIKNLVKDAFGKDKVEFDQLYGPYDKDFSDQSSFRIAPGETPADSEVDPSIGEIDTSALVDEVLKETVTETGSTPDDNFGGKGRPTQPPVTAPIVNVTMPEEQEAASPHLGQGVSAGPSPVTGSSLGGESLAGTKSITIGDVKPEPTIETDSLGDQSVDITDNNIDPPVDIPTLDLIEMVNPVDENPSTIRSGYTRIPVSVSGQPSSGGYNLPDRFTRGRPRPRPIEAQEPPNLPMPEMPETSEGTDQSSAPLDKDELQARTEQLQDELETSLAEDYIKTAKLLNAGMTDTPPDRLRALFTSYAAGGSEALDGTEWGYDHKDLSYPEVANIFNAVNINLASGKNWYGPNDPRVVEAKSNMSNSLDNAFASIEGFDPTVGSGISTYTPQTWQNLGLQPNWGNTLNIGDIGISQVPIEHIGSGGKISLFVPNRIPTKFDLDAGVITPPRHSTPGP